MKLPLELSIVSASPIYCESLQKLLAEVTEGDRTHVLLDGDCAEPISSAGPDVILVAPQNWEELDTWLPTLRKSFAYRPWLLLAEWRLAGMFLSTLETQPCFVVPPSSRPAELAAALRELDAGFCSFLPAELLARYARGAPASRGGRTFRLPTTVEMQCGCAVSLGLSNREIAKVLHLGEATIKSHIHFLLKKLELSGRHELGTAFRQALAPLPPPRCWDYSRA